MMGEGKPRGGGRVGAGNGAALGLVGVGEGLGLTNWLEMGNNI